MNSKKVLLNTIIGIIAIIIFIIVHNIGYEFYKTNFIIRSRGVSVGLTVNFLTFFVVIPFLLLSSFLRIKLSVILFVVSSIYIYSSCRSMPLRMLLIIISYFCGLCSIIALKWIINNFLSNIFYKNNEIKKLISEIKSSIYKK